MNKSIKNVLYMIADHLKDEDIVWALGASSVLYHHGLVQEVGDLDILIRIQDVDVLERLLLKIGHRVESEDSDTYETEYFGEFIVDDVEIDVMANMTIINYDLHYVYPFNKNAITDFMILKDLKIPLTSLEDWYILYHLIPNKERKITILDDYFSQHTMVHTTLIQNHTLPIWLYQKMIEKC